MEDKTDWDSMPGHYKYTKSVAAGERQKKIIIMVCSFLISKWRACGGISLSLKNFSQDGQSWSDSSQS